MARVVHRPRRRRAGLPTDFSSTKEKATRMTGRLESTGVVLEETSKQKYTEIDLLSRRPVFTCFSPEDVTVKISHDPLGSRHAHRRGCRV